MRESTLENFLKSEVKKRKGLAIKINSVGMAGLPDRMVLLPKGIMFFAELKRTGGKPRPLQTATHRILRNLGFKVYVIDTKEQAREVLKRYDSIQTPQVSANSH